MTEPFLFHLLVAFGLAYVLGHAKITAGIRENWAADHFHAHGRVRCAACSVDLTAKNTWNGRVFACPSCKGACAPIETDGPLLLQAIECPACLGFWAGAAFSLTYVLLGEGPIAGFALAPLFGLATSASNLILARLTKLM